MGHRVTAPVVRYEILKSVEIRLEIRYENVRNPEIRNLLLKKKEHRFFFFKKKFGFQDFVQFHSGFQDGFQRISGFHSCPAIGLGSVSNSETGVCEKKSPRCHPSKPSLHLFAPTSSTHF